MSSQSIDNDVVFPQSQRGHNLLPKLVDVALNLPYSSLMEVTTAFGEVVNWQLL